MSSSTTSFFSAFPGLAQDYHKVELDQTVVAIVWEEHKKVFDIFMLLRGLLNEHGMFPEVLLNKLYEEQKLSLSDNLMNIQLILEGYLDTLSRLKGK